MDERTLSVLEYDAFKRLIEPFVRTPLGRRALATLEPSIEPPEVALRKGRAGEAMRHHLEGGRLGPGGLDDPDPILERLQPGGSVLEPIEIARLTGVVEAGDAQRQGLLPAGKIYPRLWGVASAIPDLRGVTRQIAGKISADGTRVEDSASADLGRVRRRVADLEERLQRTLQHLLDQSIQRGLLQDAYVTIRNGRFVIPVRAEARSLMPGLVHGASSTGATVFVEPLQTLELNNELVSAREEELAEVRRILSAWSELLRSHLPEIEATCSGLAQLDLLGAVAAFGVSYRCVVAGEAPGAGPGRIQLLEARHPLLEAGLRARQEIPVPLTIEMIESGGVLVLSGPNAGGKTVALKTIGLLVLMNQSGLPVPSVEATLPVFRQVMADIGDHQSILESLSTFSARMVRVAQMSRGLASPALVLMDEVGAGTDPEEAGALAVAIVDHFRSRGAAVIVTTHHEPLKAYAETAPGAVNAAMEIDERTMQPTFRLRAGVAGRSGGIDLAERVGLPPAVVADARSRVSSGHRESREYAARLQQMTEEKERELQSLRSQRDAEAERHRSLQESLRRQMAELKETWQSAIEEGLRRIEEARDQFVAGIKDRTVALQLRAEARAQSRALRDQLERSLGTSLPDIQAGAGPVAGPGTADGAIRAGSRVRLRGVAGSKEIATVESVDAKGRAEVLVRGKRLTVRLHDLDLVEQPPAPVGKAPWTLPAGVRFERGGREQTPSEIKLIGATVEEALDLLDKFLDDAYLAGHSQVRIVHGHGTGRLRAAVHRMLDGHPHVASHAAADERSGGAGATVAAIKA